MVQINLNLENVHLELPSPSSDSPLFPFVIRDSRQTYLAIAQASLSLCIDMLTVLIEMSSTEV